MGGAMSWAQPLRLAPFPSTGPLAGLAVPPDVTVQRQVLAEPDIDLGDKTWARLTDGTPLVTGAHQGKGWVVLVHTTANADWSIAGDLRPVRGNAAAAGRAQRGLRRRPPPSRRCRLWKRSMADGHSRPRRPSRSPRPVGDRRQRVPDRAIRRATMAAATPGAPSTSPPASPATMPLGAMPFGVVETAFARSPEIDLKPWLLALWPCLLAHRSDHRPGAARLLLGWRRTARLAGVALLLLMPMTARGQDADSKSDPDGFAIAATTQTRLAYVKTGIPELDATSRAGPDRPDRRAQRSHRGRDRADPWASTSRATSWPSSRCSIGRYRRTSRRSRTPPSSTSTPICAAAAPSCSTPLDQSSGSSGGGYDRPGIRRLRDLARGLDIPPLMPVPPDHVLTKSFYLLQDFPGRWTGGEVWVERGEEHVNDGVSSVIIGGNDWASAWAVDSDRPPDVRGRARRRRTSARWPTASASTS